MTELELIVAAIIGVFAPWLIAVIQRQDWGDEIRYMVAMAAYVVISFFTWLLQNDLTLDGWAWRDYVKVFGVIAISGMSAFKLLWARTVAPVIEEKTSPGAP